MLGSKGLLALIVAALAVCSPLHASLISLGGANQELASRAGVFYIPFSPAHSGALDAPVPGKLHVGDQDSVRLAGASSSGYADVLLNYDLAGVFTSTKNHLVLDSAKLVFTWGDLDFAPGPMGKVSYYETVELTFLAHAADPLPATPDLVLHLGNYTAYRVTPGLDTGGVHATYEIPLKDLGVTEADAAALDANQGFAVMARYISHLNAAGESPTSVLYTNTPESAGVNGLQAEIVPAIKAPEPAGLSILALAAVILRRRRAGHRA